MAYSAIQLEVRDTIAVLTLSRPHVFNAVDDTMASEVADACGQIQQNSDVRAVILTGAGDKAFCSGGDLTEFSDALERAPTESLKRMAFRHHIVDAVANLDRPVIAAINGYALGLGLALALASDIRLASESAQFGAPDTARGFVPLSGITQRLPRLVGRAKALEMMLTAERIDAREALRVGLVNMVTPQDKLLPETYDWAQRLAGKAPIAALFAKEAVHKGMDMTLEQGLRLEADLYFLLFSTQDRTEGITAFREKRTPQFTGQ